MRSTFLACAAALLWVATAQAQGVACIHTEQDGCLEIDLIAPSYSRHVPEIQELLASDNPGQRDVTKVLDGKIAVEMYKGMRAGRIAAYSQCFPVILRFFGANEAVLTSRMAEYVLPEGASFSAHLSPSALRGKFRRSTVAAIDPTTNASYGHAVEYTLQVCGAKAALQVPWDFLPPGSAIQIEPQMATFFPDRVKGSTQSALWLTSSRLNYMRKDGGKARWEYVLIPIITPEEAPQQSPLGRPVS